MEEETKAPFWKPAFIYGVILGVVGILLSLVFYFLNVMTASWAGLVSTAVTIAVMVYCLVAYRNEYLGGFASFGEIFLMGFVIGIISSIIGVAFTYLMHNVIDPGLVEKMKIAAEEKIMNNPRIPESMYDSLFEKMEKRMEPGRMAMMGLIFGPVFNAIISLIVAAFVKKEENPVSDTI